MKFIERSFGFLATLILFACSVSSVCAQPQLVDKIVAQVGDRIVLKSEVEIQYRQALEQGLEDEGDLRCDILDQAIALNVLILQAERDSVVVGDDEVELELNRRISYFIQMFGSQEKLEETYGKTILQMKDEFREDVRSNLLAERMRGQIAGDVRISPAEVRAYFKKIPEDSLPYFDAEVQLGHLVIVPKPNEEQKEFAREKAEGFRERILEGEKLSSLANIYSDDPGSRNEGGYLGCIGRGETVPEFEAAVFQLENGEFSDVVESEFGYHIIEMVERQGERACVRHILVQPKVTSSNLNQARALLDSIRQELVSDNLEWVRAVERYSDDPMSSRTGGDILNTTDGSSFLGIDQMDRETYYAIEDLEPGEYSEPRAFQTQDGKSAYRIVLLKTETEPHVGNLEQDYSKFQGAARLEKQYAIMESYLKRKIARTYVQIDPSFAPCPQMDTWMSGTEQTAE